MDLVNHDPSPDHWSPSKRWIPIVIIRSHRHLCTRILTRDQRGDQVMGTNEGSIYPSTSRASTFESLSQLMIRVGQLVIQPFDSDDRQTLVGSIHSSNQQTNPRTNKKKKKKKKKINPSSSSSSIGPHREESPSPGEEAVGELDVDRGSQEA